MKGTTQYLSPEVCGEILGGKEVIPTKEGDVWAFGLTAYVSFLNSQRLFDLTLNYRNNSRLFQSNVRFRVRMTLF